MNSELSEIIRPFKILGVIFMVEFIGMIIFFTALYSSYDKNLFEVKVNNIDMKCFYSEKYSNGILINASTSSYNSVLNRVNRIDIKDRMILDINEYEVYYKNGYRSPDTNGWLKQENLRYDEVKDSKIKLEIKRKDKVIYDGDYISDITDYINEKGRYFIHIYVTRKDGFLTSVKTHISFNVIVGGGNRD